MKYSLVKPGREERGELLLVDRNFDVGSCSASIKLRFDKLREPGDAECGHELLPWCVEINVQRSENWGAPRRNKEKNEIGVDDAQVCEKLRHAMGVKNIPKQDPLSRSRILFETLHGGEDVVSVNVVDEFLHSLQSRPVRRSVRVGGC